MILIILVALIAGAAASANNSPLIRVNTQAHSLAFRFSDDGALQMTRLVNNQHLLVWESDSNADKAWEAGVPLITAMLTPQSPYGVQTDSGMAILSLHYNSDTEPVYSVNLPMDSNTQVGFNVHVVRMFRLLCMSSRHAPFLRYIGQ